MEHRTDPVQTAVAALRHLNPATEADARRALDLWAHRHTLTADQAAEVASHFADPPIHDRERALLERMPEHHRGLALRLRAQMWAAVRSGDEAFIDQVENVLRAVAGDEHADAGQGLGEPLHLEQEHGPVGDDR